MRKNKFNSKRTIYDGITYHSRKEANYARILDIMRNASDPKERVVDVERQVKFSIDTGEKHICNYLLDFRVTYADGRIEHIDVKGCKEGCEYNLFKLKKKMVEYIYNIIIIEK